MRSESVESQRRETSVVSVRGKRHCLPGVDPGQTACPLIHYVCVCLIYAIAISRLLGLWAKAWNSVLKCIIQLC